MLTLYHAPRSRSSRFIWLLEEIGEPYAIEYVTIRRGDGSGGPDPRNPHPDKKVPALLHDDVLVTESAAICLYLSDSFPKTKLGPGVDDARRADYLTWLSYYAGVVEPVVLAKFQGRTETDPDEKRAYEALDARVRGALRAGPYLLGDAFSAADVLLGSVFQWAPTMLPQGAEIDAYVARLSARPALQRSLARDASPTR
jgi:glutathione S-transferase